MSCPYCQTPNPAQARFCLGCGQLLLSNHLVCTTCHTLLPRNARFCIHCGAIIGQVVGACPQCGVHVAAGQAFCCQCGAQLSPPTGPPTPSAIQPVLPPLAQPAPPPEAPAPPPVTAIPTPARAPIGRGTPLLGQLPSARPMREMLASLQRYLPHALYEPLERRPTEHDLVQARDHLTKLLGTAKTYLPQPVVLAPQPAGEPAGGMYRAVFLFGDVSGFTPLSEQLKDMGREGAELITRIINDLFNELVKVLFHHGGSLLKFGGDALLGLFPAETDLEMAEGALRAVQAGLAMQEVMKQEQFAAIDAAGQTRALRIKCGISAGPYFAAHIGTEQSMAYVTTGHTVNRAEQAEGHANPGDVVITQDVHDLVAAQIQAGPPKKEPAEGFYLVHQVPPTGDVAHRHALDEPPAGELQAQITYLVDRMDCLSPYMNAELLRRIVTNPSDVRMPPDHRRVTAMFVNYVGISDLIQDMGDTHPDLIIQQLNHYFVHMVEVVERYEGTLARMDQYAVGDRLVVFFGAPRAHEDDPVRAIHTALEMQEATRQHFAALQTPKGIHRFRQRIGINTGHLFAGNAGAPDLRQEYTLMGDDINMAARLMSMADWDEILISDKTQERVSAFFDLEDRGQLKVKGKEFLIPTFRVLGHREEIGRTRGLEVGDSPLIGRDSELETLKKCGRSLLNGRGQIVSIMGDSGIGKSRLTREFKEWLLVQKGAQEVHWLESQAFSFSEQTSYWLATRMLCSTLDLGPGASKDDALFALWKRGEDLLGQGTAREAVPFLAYLMGLKLEGEWARVVNELDPQVRQKQTFWAAREFFTAAARQRPTLIILDDLHWADEASLDLFKDLLQTTFHAPLMFCFAFRPLREKGCWHLRGQAARDFPHRYVEVMLKPLTETQCQELLTHLLPEADFSSQTFQQIFDKSAGNPFYLEEIVRSLIATGAITRDEPEPDYLGELIFSLVPGAAQPESQERWRVTPKIEQITVPDTLQDIIVARMDRLSEDVRQALQMAAVIGRQFPKDILLNLAQARTELETWLAQLERNDLIQPIDLAADPTYIFPDALVQEVAYDNLVVQRRQDFHRRVGETMETHYADELDQQCESLAFHFSRSDDHERALYYQEMAGRKAQAEFANDTALEHYGQLLARLGDQEQTWAKHFDILALRQQIHSVTNEWDARRADLETMLALAQAHGDETRRADVLNELADLYQWTGRYDQAKEVARQALDLKTELEDLAGQAAALHQLGVVSYYQGDYGQARPLLERAVSLRKAMDDPAGETWSQMYLCMIHFVQGNYSQAIQHNARALRMTGTRHDWFQMGIHLTNAARISHRLGEYEQALDQFEKSLEMKTRVGDRLGQGFSLFGLGLVHVCLGRNKEAESNFQASLALRRQIDDERGISYSLHGLGLVALGWDQFDQAEDYFQQAYEIRSRLDLKGEAIADLSFLGQARLGQGKFDEAAEASSQAIALLAKQKDVEEVQQIYFNHYRVLATQEEPTAREFLQKAYQAMTDQAERIDDPEKQMAFLLQVQVNQEITSAMEDGE